MILNFMLHFATHLLSTALGSWKLKYDGQGLIMSILWNSFIKKPVNDEIKGIEISHGRASRPYNKIGVHFVCNKCKTTSSVALLHILPNIALAPPWKERLDCSIETLKLFELTMSTPKYFISVVHGKCVPNKEHRRWHNYDITAWA